MKQKCLYVASSYIHIKNFHLPYIEKLEQENIKVDILSNDEECDFNVAFKKKIYSLKNIKNISKIRRIIKNNNYDLIILNTTLAAFLVRLALLFYKNRPMVINIVHGYLFCEKTSKLKKLFYLMCEKIVRRKTDYILTMNKYDYEIAIKHKLSLNNPYFINGMGVVKLDEENVCQDSNFNLVYVAELSKRKNQIELIDLMPRLVKIIPNIKLILIGDGTYRNKLEKLVRKLNLTERVEFKGYIKDPSEYYKMCDVYVSSSKIEGLPFNILHALSFNKIVLASNIKGHNDIIKDGENGYLYDNADEFIEKITNIYNKNINQLETSETFKKYSFEKVFEENTSLLINLANKKTNMI